MKKVVALLLSAMMLLTLATGCGGGKDAGSTTPDAGQTEQKTPDAGNTGTETPTGTSDLVVGFSTGAAGTTFRQEGIDDFTKVAEE